MSDDGAGSPPRSPSGKAETDASTLEHHPALLSRLVVEHTPMAMVVLDVQGRVLWANPGFFALLGMKEGDLVGKPLTDIMRMVSWLPVPYESNSELATQQWQRIWLASEGIESSRMVLMSDMTPEPAPAGVARMLAFVELRAGQSGEFPPFADPQTGLASQWVFEDRLHHAIERADRHDQRLATLLIRLDRADDIRQAYGEAVMQTLLPQISRRLTGTLRGEDSITYLGDDRWGVLIEHPVTPENLQAAALRCLEAMEAPFQLGRPPLLLTLSIGIAMHPDDGNTPEELMGNADHALGQARPASHTFFDRELKRMLSKRMALRHSLQEALLSPDRHFDVVYQPQVDLESGCCVGVEALVRWRHPKQGVLQPDAFLPMVAEMAQMVRLDRWVIEQVMAQHQRWQSAEAPLAGLRISVNLDASLLEQTVFDDRPLDRFLRQMSGELSWLSLEIDGQVLSKQADVHSLLLRRLSRMGVRLVVDNLGSAPVDLIRLAVLPVSQGKIGREMVHGLTDSSPFARQAFSALSQCLKALQLESIVVGVETVEQLTAAREKGLDQVQGNLLGTPMAASELATWLEDLPGRQVLSES
ncbi:EAL domain-containing protein [Halomonas daqiaonensis]|uniref:PAS domain S-box-containing protein/diguanylate cyclase (GGDEF) domain-containing protein n=1 Tax=Halomonas daqiaonensis TaxID=650850 RepID=A0A1H7SS41_9GAMM|nr:EAL domain-containing protein [Halomonas daqiaonensis]SEL74886.1 PAS domain S-box-containing protein/diguanylate cyclase (GGDEF) domain-containing protein [Halomonas daqiaonensis]